MSIILDKLFIAFVFNMFYSFFSLLITYGLYYIKGKDMPDSYSDNFTYTFLTNFILIFLTFIFFNIG